MFGVAGGVIGCGYVQRDSLEGGGICHYSFSAQSAGKVTVLDPSKLLVCFCRLEQASSELIFHCLICVTQRSWP